MKQETLENYLLDTGAILKGHFLLTSGLHSDTYVEKFRILEYPKLTEKLCRSIATYFESKKPHVVVGAATGGIIISHVVAKFLACRSIFAERVSDKLTFRRGFKINPRERVLIVDDILTTGSSLYELIDLVVKQDGVIVGIGVFIDRSMGNVKFSLPYFPLVKLNIPTYNPDDCPLCKKGIPLEIRGRTGKK
ncbi:MAG: orotate phosphoribosyltransferase [Candidatus Marinimicrobia bacterium]|nr:orotate phosphoribosyltransferase [Candidatus Neomarinimicrobiota bacterium]